MEKKLSREEYRFLQYHFVQFITEHLSDVSRVFDGDLQEVLVLAIIGQVYMRADEQGRENAPIAATRIAEVTNIPRQTVRRKLQSLERRGFIYQIENGGWQLVVHDKEAVARDGLFDLDRRGIERMIKLMRTLKSHV
jgi:DNA-binding IclR family transcriptional regulator